MKAKSVSLRAVSYTHLDVYKRQVANCTYATLIYNMGVTGLKTGTTNRSGACIVTVIPVENNGKTQNLVSVIFGAENNQERYEKSMMLLKYGQQLSLIHI